MIIQSPFVWFGGKKKVANLVWEALGDVSHYVEPFFGSGAVLLRRPHAANCETVNDADGLLSNFWRAVRADPDAVAYHAANPVNECDLHARHLWLVNAKPGLTDRLMADPDHFDAKAAGWWVWGVNSWIGGGFCSGEGPWRNIDGVFSKGGTGKGVNRKLPHLGNREAFLNGWFGQIAERMHGVRVACGDWSRICGPSVLRAAGGVTGVFLDPPYSRDMRTDVYANESNSAADVLQWCGENGNDKNLRIVLAGYDGEHNELTGKGWRQVEWKAAGGYGGGRGGRGDANASKERLWLSPHCLGVAPKKQGAFGL